MLAAAGMSVAFNPKSAIVRDSARHIIEGDLRKLLPLLGTAVPVEPELRQCPYLTTRPQLRSHGRGLGLEVN
jgi:hypothetical protein